jgi:hypothetical protein
MTKLLVCAAIGLLGATGIARAQPPSEWVEHRNDKYGFILKYPANMFKLERTSEAGDGHAFVTADGKARLLVGALQNTDGSTPAAYQAQVAQQSYGKFNVTYRPVGKTWFALSGVGNGEIFYEKVIFSCSGLLINSFAIIYSVDRRDMFDPLVERMEDSFRAGTSCDHAQSTTPAAPKRQVAAPQMKPAQKRTDAERPLRARPPASPPRERGNWVVRGDGGRGYIILQQTNPPYETKIVRGQAF